MTCPDHVFGFLFLRLGLLSELTIVNHRSDVGDGKHKHSDICYSQEFKDQSPKQGTNIKPMIQDPEIKPLFGFEVDRWWPIVRVEVLRGF